ncbi:ubiquitin-conjugating enzyme E2 Z-like protein [Leptotrombidium deliense]|uniref:Ubiquitin-conjugating enzyme E2 Z-like protein n=1 Tax=Leptotrombidium deliense TaxID=299467 RepID=A0A443SD62_9ACAR|nr:ubiquitin-conjugating enzyme E2 Z-like protein [Leptotrombidium deliense]
MEWNPDRIWKTENASTMTPVALKRIKLDLADLKKVPLPDIHLHIKDADISKVYVLMEGPTETPYEGGMFYIRIQFPRNYPFSPPMVLLETTGGGNRCHYHRNMFPNGKICITILNTVENLGWSSAMNLSNALVAVQSLFSEYSKEWSPLGVNVAHVKEFRELHFSSIREQVLDVAICGMVEDRYGDATYMPDELKKKMHELFAKNYKKFEDYVRKQAPKQGQLNASNTQYNWKSIWERLKALKKGIQDPPLGPKKEDKQKKEDMEPKEEEKRENT